jgi:hypothetical protein
MNQNLNSLRNSWALSSKGSAAYALKEYPRRSRGKFYILPTLDIFYIWLNSPAPSSAGAGELSRKNFVSGPPCRLDMKNPPTAVGGICES